LYAFLVSHTRYTYPVQLTLPVLITVIIFGEVYILWSSSLCSFLRPPSISSPLRSKYSPQHPVLKHPRSVFLP
jgi:hypothetical protein